MKKASKYLRVMILVAVTLLVVSCAQTPSAPVYMKNGKEYGKTEGAFFRNRWWNHYERGLSYADGQFYKEALSDLKEAVEHRAKDQRMARTYGMHFMDYFPHRELGIIYYEMGEFDAARGELELSLREWPSAKAYYYLNQVRKKIIEREGKEVEPPRIQLDLKEEEIWTRDDPVVFSGVADSEHFVAAVAVRGNPLFLEGSKQSVFFREPLILPQGLHAVDIVAKNLAGKSAKKTVLVHVDREGPIITLEEIRTEEIGREKILTLTGSVFDDAQVFALEINGNPVPIQRGVEAFFTQKIPATERRFELVAEDRLGNRTSAQFDLPSIKTGRAPIMLAYTGGALGNVLAGLFDQKENLPPAIEIKGWTDEQAVYLEKVFIEGQVTGESRIESLTINRVPVLRRKGVHIIFNHLAELKEGKNTIHIEAKDETGNRASRTITIERRLPAALHLNQRMSLTVFPFEQRGSVSEASLSFQDNLIHSLVDRNRFRVVERNRLDLILEEQNLSQTKLIERSTALKVGQLVAAQSIVTGSIVETRQGVEAVARMIDTETAEIVATEDVYDEARDFRALRALAEGMAVKFHREFPLVGGSVIERKGKYVFSDLGQDRVKIQRRLLLYREQPVRHPVTGKSLGTDTEIIGRARVIQVDAGMSKSELISGIDEPVVLHDKVITE